MAVIGPRRERGWFFIEGDRHQVEVRRMVDQIVGETVTIPPAAFALAADDDFAEATLAGMMKGRFLLRRVGESCSFGV